MGRDPKIVEFDAQHYEPVLAAVTEMKVAKRGWVNMSPDVDPEDLPADSGPRFWSARGPMVPLCTWTPPAPKGTDPPVLIGIQHGVGAKAAPRLEELGVPVPEGWRVQADHTRRGIVIAVSGEESDQAVISWLLRAGGMLCDLPYRQWVAEVYPPN